jgi:DNA-directed RNA polymerase specialized sigma24 family protein
LTNEPRSEEIRTQVDTIYRTESRRIFATLIRLLGDFDLAEDALHEAFRVAIEQWPRDGVPPNPRAWLVSTGRFKAIDVLRFLNRFRKPITAQICPTHRPTFLWEDWLPGAAGPLAGNAKTHTSYENRSDAARQIMFGARLLAGLFHIDFARWSVFRLHNTAGHPHNY